MKLSFALALSVFGSLALAQDSEELLDIPTTATNAGVFSVLVTALGSAGLVGVLSEDGPFTVFAPTDEAFMQLPGELGPCLLRAENAELLTSILLYHVVGGAVFSSDLEDGMVVPTLNEQNITINVGETVTINGGATVTTADVEASNGVIHIIDQALIPPGIDVEGFLATCASEGGEEEEPADIAGLAVGNEDFSTLVDALSAASLVSALSAPEGPFTVFAPTNAAFAALPEGLVECLLEPDNSGALTAILTYHVVNGTVLSTDLVDGMMPATLQGEAITIDLSDGVTINDSASVVAADVVASNGVVHVIDAVLVPPSINVAEFMAASCSMMGEDDAPVAAPTGDEPAEEPEEPAADGSVSATMFVSATAVALSVIFAM